MLVELYGGLLVTRRATALLAMLTTVLLARADYHARQGKDGHLGHLKAATRWSRDAEHTAQLLNALEQRALKSPPQAQRLIYRQMLEIALRAARLRPRDPRAWEAVAFARLANGQLYKGYAALSRAVLLDPLYGPTRQDHAALARQLGDHAGAVESQRVYARIQQAVAGR